MAVRLRSRMDAGSWDVLLRHWTPMTGSISPVDGMARWISCPPL